MTSPPPLSVDLWSLRVPILLKHESTPTPLLIHVPQLSYLPSLLPRLSAHFNTPLTTFHHGEHLLRNLPLGLLLDLYTPELPWVLTVSASHAWDIRDTFLNSAKEADYTRNGNASTIMRLSAEDTESLWLAASTVDLTRYWPIYTGLLDPPIPVKNAPIRLYIPDSATGTYKVIQAAIPLTKEKAASSAVRSLAASIVLGRAGRDAAGSTPMTVGMALQKMVPELFPSVRDAIYGDAMLHGGVLPLAAPVEEVMKEAAYSDGWVCLVFRVF